MRVINWLGVGLMGALAMTVAEVAKAQPLIGRPTSAFIFPLFDSTVGKGTLITVTNTNTSRVSCRQNGFRQGDVCLLYTYFGFDVARGFCREFNREECLTPGDTLTVIAEQHNPEGEVGWLWIEARDPETNLAIDFDYLIGSAIVVDTGTDFLFQYLPYGFRGLPDEEPQPSGEGDEEEDACGRLFTDLDLEDDADFDGIEYDFWPRVLFLDEFFQEGGVNPSFENELTLASCDIDPTDDSPTHVNFGIWNNREVRFSRSFDFECFFRSPLSDISLVVNGLNGDPNELVIGARHIQQGWLDMSADDPILGVFFQRISGTGFAAGHELQFTGQFGGEEDEDLDHFPCSLHRVD